VDLPRMNVYMGVLRWSSDRSFSNLEDLKKALIKVQHEG
jgi:hypothetical protein